MILCGCEDIWHHPMYPPHSSGSHRHCWQMNYFLAHWNRGFIGPQALPFPGPLPSPETCVCCKYRVMVQYAQPTSLDRELRKTDTEKVLANVSTKQEPTFHLDLCSMTSTVNVWLYWRKESCVCGGLSFDIGIHSLQFYSCHQTQSPNCPGQGKWVCETEAS